MYHQQMGAGQHLGQQWGHRDEKGLEGAKDPQLRIFTDSVCNGKSCLFPKTAHLSQVVQVGIITAIMRSDPRTRAITTTGWASPLLQALCTRRQSSGE